MQRDAAALYTETSLIGEPPAPILSPARSALAAAHGQTAPCCEADPLFDRIVRASLHADISAPRLTLTVYDTLCVPIDPASAGTRARPRSCCSSR
jgi:hypothetical protein